VGHLGNRHNLCNPHLETGKFMQLRAYGAKEAAKRNKVIDFAMLQPVFFY